jgi:hypothetical protein
MTLQNSAEIFRPMDALHASHVAEETSLLSSRRQDGWSAANQRLFLEAIAEGYGVEAASYRVGLSRASAYAFRRTARGAAFAIGWRAATLIARDCVADTLMVRALDGQVDTYERADGTTVTRHRHDNRLAMSLLARLDRQVEIAPDADVQAARLVAQEFDAFLDLVEKDEGPARAGQFLARRSGDLSGAEHAYDLAPIHALAAADRLVHTGVATAGEVDVSDLDPADRSGWSAEQWQRAEAAGWLALAMPVPEAAKVVRVCQHCQHSHEVDAAEDDGESILPPQVWWYEDEGEWRTSFPPPEDFCGVAECEVGHIDYERELTPEELDLVGAGPDYCHPDFHDAAEMAELTEQRDAWIAGCLAALASHGPDPSAGPPPGAG